MLTDALPLLLTETIYIVPEKEKTSPVPSVAEPEVPVPAVAQPVRPRNRNRLVVIYNNIKTVYLNPEEESLLTKILGAVKLRLEDVELVNVNNHRDTLIEILRDKMANQIISFGIELRDLDIQVPLEAYRVQRVEGIDILLADSLFELQLNTDKKKMLWQALQGMFLLRR
jgi:hypothetical protein